MNIQLRITHTQTYVLTITYIIMYHVYSSGQWNIPVITGTRPPPCAHFTMNTLPANRGVMFGGVTISEGNNFHCVNDLYLFQYSDNTIVSVYY